MSQPLKDRILAYVASRPGKSATEIAHALDAKGASVSSALCVFTNIGQVIRKEGEGPRGGYVYFIAPPKVPYKTRFERPPPL